MSKEAKEKTNESRNLFKKREIKMMSRVELTDIIYELEEQVAQMQEENNALQQEIETLQKALEDRTIRLEKAGSIAEAALTLNGVFEAAQQAADEYFASVREALSVRDGGALQSQVDEILAQAKRQGEEKAAQIAREAREQAEQEAEPIRMEILQRAEEEASAVREQAELEATAMREQAADEIVNLQVEFYTEIRDTLQKYPSLVHRMRQK